MRAVILCLGGIVLSAVLSGCGETKQDELSTASERHDAAAGAVPYSADLDENLLPRDGEDPQAHDTETYDHIVENEFLSARANPLSTFSIDVDTASYSIVRRFLNRDHLPPAGAVRIEELINYFSYDYAPPQGETPFAVNAEVASCPWTPKHRLLRIGLKGKVIDAGERPASNLVFLIDVSGSMGRSNKLPLVKRSLQRLLDELGGTDRVALVTYAGSSGVVLPSTPCDQKHIIASAIENLDAGGSTHGSEGLLAAYDVAMAGFLPEGTNRVILCTDGDFNVGITNQSELVQLIEQKAKTGIALSVLGFGMGNYKDSTMEKLADHGNGNYAYIDTFAEARKVFVEQLSGTLVTIAKDVKIQIEFNPAHVAAYRLIGYENRLLAAEDFRDDQKDAGEIGAGHTVTALYEIVLAGSDSPAREVPKLRYQSEPALTPAAESGELLTLRLRYQSPDDSEVAELEFPIFDSGAPFERASGDFQFASSVAAYGMLLRGSKFSGNASWDAVLEWAKPAVGNDPFGYRQEFLQLVKTAKQLSSPEVTMLGRR